MTDKIRKDREISDNILIELRKIIQSVDLNSKKLVKQVGLTGPQLVILQEISRLGTVSVGEVAKNVSLSQGTVTGILVRMEKRGVVIRQRSRQDKRRVMVRITKSGNMLLSNAPSVIEKSFLSKFNELQAWEKTMILSALQRLVFIMNAAGKNETPLLSAKSLNFLDRKNGKKDSSSVS